MYCRRFNSERVEIPSAGFKACRLAANEGNMHALAALGVCYRFFEYNFFAEKAFNSQKALNCFELAANLGHAPSQECLGKIYADGNGVEKNYFESAKWFKLAAEQGMSFAQARLGACYLGGIGVDVDRVEAIKWYKKAALDPKINTSMTEVVKILLKISIEPEELMNS